MQGRRIYPNSGNGLKLKPGDYGLIDGTWHGESPNGHLANLGAHQVTEHDDGTITVSPSILISTSVDGVKTAVYHGFLERGIWRDA